MHHHGNVIDIDPEAMRLAAEDYAAARANLATLATRLGVCTITVSQRLRAMGVRIRKQGFPRGTQRRKAPTHPAPHPAVFPISDSSSFIRPPTKAQLMAGR